MKKKLIAIATTALLVVASAMPASAGTISATPSGSLSGSFSQSASLPGRNGYGTHVEASVYGAYRPKTSIAEYVERSAFSMHGVPASMGGASITVSVSAPAGYVPIEGSGVGSKYGYYFN